MYWEEAVALCIPEFRRFNPTAVSNVKPPRNTPRMAKTPAMLDYENLGAAPNATKFSTLFTQIDGFRTVDDLASYVGGRERMKYLAWNFAHMEPERR